jgi:hypothetical protein
MRRFSESDMAANISVNVGGFGREGLRIHEGFSML